MSEPAPATPPDHATQGYAGPLTPEAVERLLADFRSWLEEVAAGEGPDEATLPPAADAPDLHTLLGQMIAVRQEVNLQTRAVRTQQEQSASVIDALSSAVEELRKVPRAAAPPPPPDDLLRPLLRTLIDLNDAMSLALGEAERVEESVLPLLELILEFPEPEPVSLAEVNVAPLRQTDRPLLARMMGVCGVDPRTLDDWQGQVRAAYEKGSHDMLAVCLADLRARSEPALEAVARVRQFLSSLIAGYRMGVQRIDRALQQHGLEPIPAEGEPFDPERMEVLEVVTDSGHPPGEVVEELRRGYLWRGRVFRYAQVRVAKS